MKKSSHSYEDPNSILGIVILPNSLYGTWSDKYKFFLFGCVYKFSVHILNISEFGDSIPMDNSDILRSKTTKTRYRGNQIEISIFNFSRGYYNISNHIFLFGLNIFLCIQLGSKPAIERTLEKRLQSFDIKRFIIYFYAFGLHNTTITYMYLPPAAVVSLKTLCGYA